MALDWLTQLFTGGGGPTAAQPAANQPPGLPGTLVEGAPAANGGGLDPAKILQMISIAGALSEKLDPFGQGGAAGGAAGELASTALAGNAQQQQTAAALRTIFGGATQPVSPAGIPDTATNPAPAATGLASTKVTPVSPARPMADSAINGSPPAMATPNFQQAPTDQSGTTTTGTGSDSLGSDPLWALGLTPDGLRTVNQAVDSNIGRALESRGLSLAEKREADRSHWDNKLNPLELQKKQKELELARTPEEIATLDWKYREKAIKLENEGHQQVAEIQAGRAQMQPDGTIFYPPQGDKPAHVELPSQQAIEWRLRLEEAKNATSTEPKPFMTGNDATTKAALSTVPTIAAGIAKLVGPSLAQEVNMYTDDPIYGKQPNYYKAITYLQSLINTPIDGPDPKFTKGQIEGLKQLKTQVEREYQARVGRLQQGDVTSPSASEIGSALAGQPTFPAGVDYQDNKTSASRMIVADKELAIKQTMEKHGLSRDEAESYVDKAYRDK